MSSATQDVVLGNYRKPFQGDCSHILPSLTPLMASGATIFGHFTDSYCPSIGSSPSYLLGSVISCGVGGVAPIFVLVLSMTVLVLVIELRATVRASPGPLKVRP